MKKRLLCFACNDIKPTFFKKIAAMGIKDMITFKNVNKWFGKHHVLKEINLNVEPGEVLVVCGPSGSGKSTLLRCINRLESLQSGEIIIDGIKVHGRETNITKLRAEIGFVFQQFNLYPHMTAIENITIAPIKVRKLKKEVARKLGQEILDKVGLGDKAGSYPSQLSGGQQQRLCIARAIAINPEVLLMDEPCSALDPIATSKIEDLMWELKENYSIIIVTHSMQQAARVSQRTGFFHLGDLVEVDTTENIFQNPVESRTRDYITGRFG